MKSIDARAPRIGYALAIVWGIAIPFLRMGWCAVLGGSVVLGITVAWLFARSHRRNSN